MRNLHVNILIVMLVATGLGLAYAKHRFLGLPFMPDREADIWIAEARVEFDGLRRSATVSLDIPSDTGQFVKLDEYFISRNFGLKTEMRGTRRVAEWSVRRAQGPQRLYYQIELVPQVEPAGEKAPRSRSPRPPAKPDYPESLGLAVESVLDDVRGESANVFTFVSQLLVRLNTHTEDTDIQILTRGLTPGTDEWVERIRYILAGAQITTRLVRGLVLEDGTVNEGLAPWLEVHNGQRWEGFDPMTGDRGFPRNFMRWSTGSEPVLSVENGRNAHVSFSVSHRPQAMAIIARDRARAIASPLDSWSLFNLPVNTQQVYAVLIMIPLGALVVVFMRTMIGVPTFGTFMPILIALAFRETGLLWGITLFSFIVSAGLLLRLYLNRLRLLIVARLAAVLTLVVMIMMGISQLSNELGLVQGFSIALFPIVILTMVIERMSVRWDESGAAAALKEAAGSLLIGVIGYMLMNNPVLEHVMFAFPELTLVILAACLAMGTYTGYRLSELMRFRDLAVDEEAKDAEPGPKDP